MVTNRVLPSAFFGILEELQVDRATVVPLLLNQVAGERVPLGVEREHLLHFSGVLFHAEQSLEGDPAAGADDLVEQLRLPHPFGLVFDECSGPFVSPAGEGAAEVAGEGSCGSPREE